MAGLTCLLAPSFALLVAVAVASPGADPERDTRADRLSESEIDALTRGRTFHYTLLGEPRGEEQHFEDGRVVWRLPDGLCMHGIWVVTGPMLCYYYGAMRYGCWNVIEAGGQYSHAPTELDGTPGDGPSVTIVRISDEPVACAPQQLASGPSEGPPA